MSKDALTLAYLNEDDRTYGLAGMTISLAALDAIDKVVKISIDEEGPMVTFSHEYYYSGSPSVSPKATWDHLLENLHLSASMVMANVMARSIVRLGQEVPQELLDTIYNTIAEEGREACNLEDDEIQALYQKALTYNRRIFRNPRLRPAIQELVRFIARQRTLSGLEIRDELHLLQII